jgi:hypothetical protein
MWPWQAQSRNILEIRPFDVTRVSGHAPSSTKGNREGGLVLLAPGISKRESSEDALAGDFHACIGPDFVMPPEVLSLATSQVQRLDVAFESGLTDMACLLWIFELKELVGLSMSRYPFRTLSDEIAKLKKLEHLHMYGSSLIKVPRSLGCLSNLMELDLYTSYGLHYLPIEVLACTKLSSSRFSTRALYQNGKGTKGIPVLPDWRTASESAMSYAYALAIFVRGSSLTEPLVKRMLDFLPWNRCSICSQTYVHDFGCYAWAHRRVATDAQALLAFCCSRRCLRRVPNPVQTADPSLSWNMADHLLPWDLACEVKAPFQSIPITFQETRGRASVTEAAVDMGAGVEVETQNYQTVANGDLRSTPGGKQLGRLGNSKIVFGTRECIVPRDLRKWVLLHQRSKDEIVSVLGWTAMTKKDGTPKLRVLGSRGY